MRIDAKIRSLIVMGIILIGFVALLLLLTHVIQLAIFGGIIGGILIFVIIIVEMIFIFLIVYKIIRYIEILFEGKEKARKGDILERCIKIFK